jgi:hypothetical protein
MQPGSCLHRKVKTPRQGPMHLHQNHDTLDEDYSVSFERVTRITSHTLHKLHQEAKIFCAHF